MFERPEHGERVVLVHIAFKQVPVPADLEEFRGLAHAAGVDVVTLITGTRETPDPKWFIGSGKVEEIQQWITNEEIDLVLFNHDLSPAQERNLEKALKVRVVGRTGLILDIFASRARTFEGKLQVELAQLEHLSTRLVRGWTHLERQKGGIGLRGPGETQLETDRRLLRDRIQYIQKRLARVRKGRHISRRARQRQQIATVALVGYTNAGKSTLFNRLTGAEVFVADQLFATLDPTLRTLQLPAVGKVILADTVGFVRDLPHQLVDAFRATLEETRQADLLLHVVDAHDPAHQDTQAKVEETLEEIGADQVPSLLVYNKIDQMQEVPPKLDHDETGQAARVWLSAHTGEGLDLLQEAIVQRLAHHMVSGTLILAPHQAQVRAALYAIGAVVEETISDTGDMQLAICLPSVAWEQLCTKYQELKDKL